MFASCEVKQYFPSCVWVHQLQDYAAMNAEMIDALGSLRETSGFLSGGAGWQSRGNLHELPAFAALTRCIGAASKGVLDFLKVECDGFVITNCWANVNPGGHSHQIHTHPNNFLSGVYYVTAPEGSGDIEFHDPRQQAIVLLPKVSGYTPFNSSKHTIAPREGQLLVFQSWFQHLVKENRSDQDRISISFNSMIKGQMGYESGQAFL